MHGVLTFLSDEWIAALDAAVGHDPDLATLTADLAFTIEQEVTGGPFGDVRYHVAFDHGRVSVSPGPADQATIRFSQDLDTAAAIASGEGSAQRAFMTGRLRVGGDLRMLLAHGEVLTQLDDVFAEVRARTVVAKSAAEPDAEPGATPPQASAPSSATSG